MPFFKHQNSQYARSLIEASHDPLLTINIDGKITDMNQATVDIIGIEREKLTGTNFLSYFTDPQKAKAVYKKIFAENSVTDSPLILVNSEGQLFDVIFNGSTYKNDSGIVQGVVVVARDVTDKNKIKANLEKSLKEISGYKKAIDESSIVAITDSKSIINYVNDNFCKTSMYSRKELIGKTHKLVNSKYHSSTFMKLLWDTISAGKVWHGEIKNRTKAGDFYWVDTTIVPFQDELGEIYQFVSISYDITDKKMLSQYTLSLIEASRDPLVTLSKEGKIMDMNEAMVRVTGFTRQELKGTDFKNYFLETQKASEVYQEVFSKGFVADFPLTIKDGKLTDVLFNGSVYKDDLGVVLGAVIVARDITEQKRIEIELTEAKVFAELATSFAEEEKEKAEKATQIAEVAVRSKQQFLSNMSHEIRTPMNAIIGFTKVLLKTELTEKQNEYFSAIKISGDALIVLINDILDLAKVDAGKMVFEQIPFSLTNTIPSMLHLFETKIKEKNLDLIVSIDKNIPKTLVGDPVRLHQIILNLVSNAIKFTLDGEILVDVRLLSQNKQHATVEFSVKDTGIGIPKDKIESIFENFQQATSGTSRIFGGTGLGLAIVKQLVENQGGSVKVVSEINEGSTFSFVLSFNKSSEKASEETIFIQPTIDTKNIKVLVVEDIPINQLLMKTILDDFGFQRDIAANGKIAIQMLEEKQYDIILMDLQMPEMNGFEATEYIRNTLKSSIPIIALTADVTTVDVEKCREAGMNDYMSKPLDERILYTKIMEFVKHPPTFNFQVEAMDKENDKLDFIINLSYLTAHTKSNPKMMQEIILAFLEQTPTLILLIKKSMLEKDWITLNAAVHKMIPSFSIVGMDKTYEKMAKRLQEYALLQEQNSDINQIISHLEDACTIACKELKEEYNRIKSTQNER
jgi:PAS domain S-box-containing protein